eukprot:768663-Hanusia_phi.AAC.6
MGTSRKTQKKGVEACSVNNLRIGPELLFDDLKDLPPPRPVADSHPLQPILAQSLLSVLAHSTGQDVRGGERPGRGGSRKEKRGGGRRGRGERVSSGGKAGAERRDHQRASCHRAPLKQQRFLRMSVAPEPVSDLRHRPGSVKSQSDSEAGESGD